MRTCTLITRYGIEDITASAGVLAPSLKRAAANCDLHRPEEVPYLHINWEQEMPLFLEIGNRGGRAPDGS
jgi:hypothetical protein